MVVLCRRGLNSIGSIYRSVGSERRVKGKSQSVDDADFGLSGEHPGLACGDLSLPHPTPVCDTMKGIGKAFSR